MQPMRRSRRHSCGFGDAKANKHEPTIEKVAMMEGGFKGGGRGGGGRKRKQPPSSRGRSLQDRIRAAGGATGFALDHEDGNHQSNARSSIGRLVTREDLSSAATRPYFSSARSFLNNKPGNNGGSTTTPRSSARTSASSRPRSSRASSKSHHQYPGLSPAQSVHVVCAISENLAQKTCVASIDAGVPTVLQVTKQANGQTYAETLAYLEILKPDEILLNEGRRNSQLVRKIVDMFQQQQERNKKMANTTAAETTVGGEDDENEDEQQPQPDSIGRFGDAGAQVVIKFVSRSWFDQTKGGQLIKAVAREETYDASFLSEYILLAASHAVLHYLQQSLGAFFAKKSVHLNISAGGRNRMEIDRSTMLQLELLVNHKTGKTRDSLVATIDRTKTSVGSRLLRTSLMSPPTRAETVNARLDLVDLFLGCEDFFYTVYDHLDALPGIDKVLANIALVPTKQGNNENNTSMNERIASRGIAALVCMKSVLQALPSFAAELQSHLTHVEQQDASIANDDTTIVTNQASLHLGLGSGNVATVNRNHLIRAIIFAMTQPSLLVVLQSVTDIFAESATFCRNTQEMRHQVCFAFKCDDHEMMAVIRKAFMSNIDDIYKKADEYAEVFGISVKVRFSATRGYFLTVPIDVEDNLPDIFLQACKSGRNINCTTEEVASLSSRAQDNVQDLLLMTHDRIQEVMAVAREHYDSLAALSDAIALLDLCHSFADYVSSQG
jgi:DNA mismatch repair protein MSH4